MIAAAVRAGKLSRPSIVAMNQVQTDSGILMRFMPRARRFRIVAM